MQKENLTDRQFADFSAVIHSHLGIKMPYSKKGMLQSRLQRRLRYLEMDNLQEYHAWFFWDEKNQDQELEHLLNLATTNKTDFFREPAHFNYLTQHIFADWRTQKHTGPFRLWSAGCSSGEEAYSMAMLLLDEQESFAFDFSVLGTDISTHILHKAMKAIYSEEDIQPIPISMRTKYLLRNRDRKKRDVRIAQEVRKRIRFGILNFQAPEYGLRNKMDVVFFRNVMIYFERNDQVQIVTRLCRNMRPGGYLVVGHSESLNGYDLPLRSLHPATYRYEP